MTQQPNNLPLRLALNRAPQLGAISLRHLLENCGPPENWRNVSDNTLRTGLKSPQWQSLADVLASEPTRYPGVAADLDWLSNPDCAVLCLDQTDYPVMLRQIYDAPFVIFTKGKMLALHLPQIAVVGTRHPTRMGLKDCADFSAHLTQKGFAITSGLALGIDGAAHRAALDAGGVTIAVLAHGLNQVYPGRHRLLASQIIERGVLVSEFPIGVDPAPEYFPRRNRIISGLSLGVLVVEAALQSGSLITAREALEQGREVFAIPGSIHNPLSRGCHRLIRQGAKLVETGNDILEDLGALLQTALPGLALVTAPKQQANGLQPSEPSAFDVLGLEKSGFETKLLHLLDHEPQCVNELVEKSGRSAAEVNATLVMLELEGHVLQVRGHYVRT